MLLQQLDLSKTFAMNFKAVDGDFLLFSQVLYPNGDWSLKRMLYAFLPTQHKQFMTLRHSDKSRWKYFLPEASSNRIQIFMWRMLLEAEANELL